MRSGRRRRVGRISVGFIFDCGMIFDSVLCKELEKRAKIMRAGGGAVRQSKQRAKGKLTVRERISFLLDKGSFCIEVGVFAGWEMYLSHGGCPSGGVVVVLGRVGGVSCVVVANDATIKAGAWFPITAKKNLRAQEIAMENRLPVIYLVDSAGVYLPLQDEIFPDKEHFGRQFRNNAHMSALGIVQLSAIMGSCVAGGAYLPAMSDESLIVEGTGSIFLAGSHLVKAAIGEEVDNETLGGAVSHTVHSGVVDNKYKDDKACLEAIRARFSLLPKDRQTHALRREACAPIRDDIYDCFPSDRTQSYEVRDVLSCILDGNSFQEYKSDYGRTLVCGYARLDGWSVGVVASQRKMVRKGDGEQQMGGVIYSDSACKAARFIMNCNQKGFPLLFFHDVSGFMVGKRAEHGGIIKDGAKMVNAVSNSIVPKFSIIMGNSYGAGNYAMCGKAYDPCFIWAWPTARIGVMSAASASGTLWGIQEAQMKGGSLSEAQRNAQKADISRRYEETLSPYYAAARLWVDDIIAPAHTREILSHALPLSLYGRPKSTFSTGVIQT